MITGSIRQLSERLRNQSITSVQLLNECLAKIAKENSLIHAFTSINQKLATAQAQQADIDFKKGIVKSDLQGIPYGLKDVFEVVGEPMECHSSLWKGYVSKKSSSVYQRLEKAGAVYVGKLATHELALGGPSHELPYPVARNPYDLDYFTGASSSGAGAAVSAGFVPFAIGTDTSGSVRGPACHCGVVGFKPSLGTVSKTGVYPLSYSLDHCGPIVRQVEDLVPVMKVIKGFDTSDPIMSKSVCEAVDTNPIHSFDKQPIAYPRHLFTQDGVEPELLKQSDRIVEMLRVRGIPVEEIHFADFDLYNACGRTIMIAEGYNINAEDLEKNPQKFGRYTFQRLIQGAQISSNDYLNAIRIRSRLVEKIKLEIFTRFQLLLFPSSLVSPPKLSEFPAHWPPSKKLNWTATVPFNVTGNPSINIPVGLASSGLPIGVQLVADLAYDRFLIEFSRYLESLISFNQQFTNPFFNNTISLEKVNEVTCN